MLSLKVESWIWWSVVIVVSASRFTSRRMILGSFRRYQVDEYMMAVVLCFYTTLIVTINIVRHTNSNLLPPGYDIHDLTSQDKHERMYGSKLILVVEQCQCVTVWGAKLCLVALYLRLTTLRKENIAIKILGAYIVGSFVVMDILYFGVWCRPFSNYWAVPTPNRQCDAASDHLITNTVFNLSSDCIMLAIGLPMFLRLNLQWQKKLPLIAVFSLGVFVILAAILNKVYSFTEPFGSRWTYWYVRESSTALLVANLPYVWTLWRKVVGVPRTLVAASQNATANTRVSHDERPGEPRTGKESGAGGSVNGSEDWLAALRRRSDQDLEMGTAPAAGVGRQMTLEDMLKEDTSNTAASAKSESPNPITHPRLFFGSTLSSSRPGGEENTPSAQLEKAVLTDSPVRETVRWSSTSDEKPQVENPSARSMEIPSLDSKKSVGSIV